MKMERIGRLDILKFIMSINIMALHYHWRPVMLSINDKELAFGRTGYYAVIFFFIVSGAMLVRSYKAKQGITKRTDVESIGKQTQVFMKKKILKFLPLYLFALLLYVVKDLVINKSIKNVLVNLFYSIPSCFLIGYLGFDKKDVYSGGYYVGASWYLSALIIMMMISYPMVCKNYDLFTKVIAPIIFIISIYINVSVLGIPIVDSRLYPVIPFTLGVIVGDLSTNEKPEEQYTKALRMTLCGIEIVCFIMLQTYLCIGTAEMKMTEYPMLFITAILVYVVCLGTTPWGNLNCNISYWLGKLSFILYLVHVPVYEIFQELLKKNDVIINYNMNFLLSSGLAIMVSVGYMFLSEHLKINKQRI